MKKGADAFFYTGLRQEAHWVSSGSSQDHIVNILTHFNLSFCTPKSSVELSQRRTLIALGTVQEDAALKRPTGIPSLSLVSQVKDFVQGAGTHRNFTRHSKLESKVCTPGEEGQWGIAAPHHALHPWAIGGKASP
eukprot:4241224-Amphidinium_carterae.1